jgi:dephospho-CoA kinase
LTLSVALTGNIAAGKSSVAGLFERWGATVIDADKLVREAQAPGQPTLESIAKRFGPGVISSDGTLDRAALRSRVLADSNELADLNRIVHPEVHRRRLELLAEARNRGDRIVVSDIPLLFEVDDPSAFDAIVLVEAPEQVRRARLMQSRALEPAQADRMMAAQMDAGQKRGLSDYVIDNDGDFAALERAAALVWDSLLARA